MPHLKDELEDFIRDISPMLTKPDAVSSSQLQPSGTIVQALHDAVAWGLGRRNKQPVSCVEVYIP